MKPPTGDKLRVRRKPARFSAHLALNCDGRYPRLIALAVWAEGEIGDLWLSSIAEARAHAEEIVALCDAAEGDLPGFSTDDPPHFRHPDGSREIITW